MFVYIDEEFAINRIQPKFLSLLLAGKFRRGVAERVHLERILTKGEYIVLAAVHSIILLFANRLCKESNLSWIICRSRSCDYAWRAPFLLCTCSITGGFEITPVA